MTTPLAPLFSMDDIANIAALPLLSPHETSPYAPSVADGTADAVSAQSQWFANGAGTTYEMTWAPGWNVPTLTVRIRKFGAAQDVPNRCIGAAACTLNSCVAAVGAHSDMLTRERQPAPMVYRTKPNITRPMARIRIRPKWFGHLALTTQV